MDATTYIVQLLTFLAFFYLLYRLAGRSLATLLRTRTERIEANLRAAGESQRRAQETTAETARLLEQARGEAQGIAASAHNAADLQHSALLEQGQRDAEGLLRRARDTIDRERQAAVDALRREASRIAILAAGRVVDTSLQSDAATRRELADQTIADVGGGR